jgi:hypothetical protein
LLPPEAVAAIRFGILGLCVLGLALLIVRLLTYTSSRPDEAMPGMWRTANVSGYQGARQEP